MSEPAAARRLLENTVSFIVDGVVVAPRSDVAESSLAGAVDQAQQDVPRAAYDLNVSNSAVERVQIRSVVFVTQNSQENTLIVVQAPQEQGVWFSPLSLLFVALCVLVCICAYQKDGLKRKEEDVGADPKTNTNADGL